MNRSINTQASSAMKLAKNHAGHSVVFATVKRYKNSGSKYAKYAFSISSCGFFEGNNKAKMQKSFKAVIAAQIECDTLTRDYLDLLTEVAKANYK